MKKLIKMQRFMLENPTRSLADLFSQITRSLPDSNVFSNEDGDIYSLRQDSLQIEFTQQYDFQRGKTERLVIIKDWQQDNCIERITIQDEYDDLKDWIVETVIGRLCSIKSISNECKEAIREVSTPVNDKADKVDFAFDLAAMWYELRESKIEYFTDKINRGLQSIAALRMPQYVDWQTSSGEAMIKRIFDEMLNDKYVEEELNLKLGRSSNKTKSKFLHSGKLYTDKPFSFSEQDSYHKWQDMSFELIWLCRYFGGMEMPKGLHNEKRYDLKE